jgi:hypothetical protein
VNWPKPQRFRGAAPAMTVSAHQAVPAAGCGVALLPAERRQTIETITKVVKRLTLWGRGAERRTSRGKGPTVADNLELIMRFHCVGGEDVSLISADFGGEAEALEAITRALDERRSLVLIRARYNREAGENGVVINLANVVSVRVSKTDSDTTGQYL